VPQLPASWTDSVTTSILGNIDLLRLQAIDGQLIAVCDETYKAPFATAAWIITSRSLIDTVSILGSARTPGSAADMDSHRAEATGLMGILWTLKEYFKQWDITTTVKVIIACDNDSALHYALNSKRYTDIDCSIPDFALFRQIRSLMIPLITYTLEHVAGHQDDIITVLSHMEYLNVQMDTNAKAARATVEQQNPHSTWYPELPIPHWKVTIDPATELGKEVPKSLQDYVSQQNMTLHWHKRKKIAPEFFSSTDWIALGKAMKATTMNRRIWIVKHASGQCGVNLIRHRRKERENDACPRCGASETAAHVWICQHEGARQIWENALQQLELWLRNSTGAHIADQLIRYLRSWHTSTLPAQTDDLDTLATIQHQIGWDNFIEGRIGNCWREAHELYLLSTQKQGSSYRWTTQLIQKMWNIAWDLWEHRNGIEHEKDQEIATTEANATIQLELQKGFTSIPEYNMSTTAADKMVLSATLPYKLAWIRNIQVARERATRRTHPTLNEMNRMRQNLRQFLITENN
jgi:hypothetical protein